MRQIQPHIRHHPKLNGRKKPKNHSQEIVYAGAAGRACRRLRGRIKSLEKELGRVAEVLSHDLRSYMVSICGFAALLLDESKRPRHGKSRHYIQRIEGNIRDMDLSLQAVIRQVRSVFTTDDFYRPKPVGTIPWYKETGKTQGGINGEGTI